MKTIYIIFIAIICIIILYYITAYYFVDCEYSDWEEWSPCDSDTKTKIRHKKAKSTILGKIFHRNCKDLDDVEPCVPVFTGFIVDVGVNPISEETSLLTNIEIKLSDTSKRVWSMPGIGGVSYPDYAEIKFDPIDKTVQAVYRDGYTKTVKTLPTSSPFGSDNQVYGLPIKTVGATSKAFYGNGNVIITIKKIIWT
jgi:hypothetical protein